MQQDQDIYFHLGYPKVASTFLQKEIFPNLKGIKFHKKHRFNSYKQLDPDNLRETHMFSSEKDYNIEEAADDILTRFPQAKIILILRRHDQWILSRYKYYIRKHGGKEFHEFFDLEEDKGLWKREDLFYRKKIDYLKTHTQNPPLIMTLDLLQKDPDRFFKKIEEYTGSKIGEKANKGNVVNRAFSQKQLLVLKKFNKFYPYHKIKTPYRFINRSHYRYRQYLLHMVAFFSHLIPWALIKKRQLVDSSQLDEIRKYYAEDWEYCTRG
jgi:hypothetical protein